MSEAKEKIMVGETDNSLTQINVINLEQEVDLEWMIFERIIYIFI